MPNKPTRFQADSHPVNVDGLASRNSFVERFKNYGYGCILELKIINRALPRKVSRLEGWAAARITDPYDHLRDHARRIQKKFMNNTSSMTKHPPAANATCQIVIFEDSGIRRN